METDRPDAHFRDPFARACWLALGGAALMERLPDGAITASSCIVRSCLMDSFILQSIDEAAIDTVVDLGAGLDTRPLSTALASITHLD